MGIKQLSLGRTDITYLDPRILKADPGFNEREEETEAFKTALAALELSIDAQGVLVPIVLKRNKGGDDGYTYTDGHRRMICVMNLIAKGRDIRKVPTRFEPDGTNDLDRILSMIPLNGGLPFTPYEKAKVIKKAHGFGVEYAEIAEKIGISLEYINAILLPLLESPQAILNEVKTGKLSASLAVQVQKENPVEAPGILQEAKEIAEATDSPKTTLKHVRKAKEAREPAKKVRGEDKPAPETDWASVGPFLKELLENIFNADPKGVGKAITDAANAYDNVFSAKV